MKTQFVARGSMWHWMIGVLLLAPIQLGAKGCETGVVGDDGTSAGKSCGGGARVQHTCAADEFCKFAPDDDCGTADGAGICTAIPQACTAIYSPVCGCDGETYDNECVAEMAGVSVTSQGYCDSIGRTCGGNTGITCAAGEFCNVPIENQCSAADGPGTCMAIPQACDMIYSPVCGCDGKTYGNACSAAMVGVSVAATGACAPAGKICGGNTRVTCAAGEFCNTPMENQCGAADGTGICTAIPQACDMIYSPVCGCDGKTYSSDCTAALSGVSVASIGACESAGKTCGGNTGVTCAAGEFCNVPVENQCSAADGPGTCTAIPQFCPTIYLPVCGCDGKTYGNACSAATAGISVAAEGACTS